MRSCGLWNTPAETMISLVAYNSVSIPGVIPPAEAVEDVVAPVDSTKATPIAFVVPFSKIWIVDRQHDSRIDHSVAVPHDPLDQSSGEDDELSAFRYAVFAPQCLGLQEVRRS